ncbi:MAG TPA: LuxR C-terminal-related transcriptional regulator [Microbacteriaceae bacterium]|nr:LuxR C-terminal-related transcriptional regulator [Microbacteriaceae bacterium]
MIDQERLLGEALSAWLHTHEPQLRMVTFVNDWDAFRARADTRVDVILLCLDCTRGPELPTWVRAAVDNGTHVLAIAREPVPWLLRAILPAGANGFVAKTDSPHVLSTAIRALARGSSHLTRDVTASVIRSNLPKLSFQERRVMLRYAAGATVGEVAKELSITEETAKSYLKRIRQKYRAVGISVSTKVDLHRQAMNEGLLADSPDPRPTTNR